LNTQTYESRSARATERFATRLAATVQPGDVIALIGELGAGKTCFTRGLARGLSVPTDVPVTSPTFTMMNHYEGRLPLYHFDLYRVTDLDELEAIGYREFVGGDGVAVMEWADRVPNALPVAHIRIEIHLGKKANERRITVEHIQPLA
jgi:tRNA threonylcarbamoyladenosine biosynthesis protein TsaE